MKMNYEKRIPSLLYSGLKKKATGKGCAEVVFAKGGAMHCGYDKYTDKSAEEA
ncbi:MAG: hypothetical protein IJB81_02630 [Clostridia bacterium]|nr:hypothetical protein [Clostridia bacterium]